MEPEAFDGSRRLRRSEGPQVHREDTSFTLSAWKPSKVKVMHIHLELNVAVGLL